MSRDGNLESKVYVGDISRDVTEKDLEREFEQYGRVKKVWVARNPPGFAFVEYEDPRDADDAIKGLDGQSRLDCRLRVEPATGKRRPKPWDREFDRGPPRGGGYGIRGPPRYDPYRAPNRYEDRRGYDDGYGRGSYGGGGGRESYGRDRGAYRPRSRSPKRKRSYSRSRSRSGSRGRGPRSPPPKRRSESRERD